MIVFPNIYTDFRYQNYLTEQDVDKFVDVVLVASFHVSRTIELKSRQSVRL